MRSDKRTQASRGKRREAIRELRARILIICEGSKTEPNYFESFKKEPLLVVRDIEINIEGMGQNTDRLVETAIKLKNDAKKSDDDYSKVWCVFDRDSFPAVNFNRAFDLVKSENQRMKDNNIDTLIDIAYTNEAFELWYLLHFEYRNTAMSRTEYSAKLTEHISKLTKNKEFKYKKNLLNIYEILLPIQHIAIKNAKKLLKEYDNHNPEKDNPSTRVHVLVEELNKLLNKGH